MKSSNNHSYPHNKDIFGNQTASQPDVLGKAVNEFLTEIIVSSAIGVCVLIKSLFSRYAPLSLAAVGFIVWLGYYISTEALHIQFVYSLYPDFFTPERLMPFYKIHRDYYWGAFSFAFLLIILTPLGGYMRFVATKYKDIFCKIGLSNSMGETPKLLRKERVDLSRTKYIFDTCGLGITEFENKRERLEAYFRENIESIKHGKNKSRIEIVFNKQDFPERLNYSELANSSILPPHSFFVGYSDEGVLTQSISELPHLLIAGTTGSGKSVCMKQILMGLLESTPHLQMYLVDLKGGLEMIDFKGLPNVQVVKNVSDTLKVFRCVESEMKKRFDYLEASGKKQIIPEKDEKDRIVVAVDEASILYMSRATNDPNSKSALEARSLADSIAKLSRAAAIHLILATQKVEGKVIPTSVTENISGRMVFRVNSFQGSNQVIGSKDAMMLPEIPGRGIWSFGTKRLTIQAPFIGEREIKQRCLKIAEDFQNEERKCFHLMIGKSEKNQEEKLQNIAYGNVPESESETHSVSSEAQKKEENEEKN